MPRLFDNNIANYLDAGDLVQFPGPRLTVSAWVWFNSIADENKLVAKWGTVSSNQEWILQGTVSAGYKALFATTNGGGSYAIVTGTTNLTTGRWYHIVGTSGGSNTRLYVDGRLDAVPIGAFTYPDSTMAVRIGRDLTGDPHNGLLAHIAIWSAELTAVEILMLAKGALPSTVRPQKLGAWWPMEMGSNELDRSRFGSTATLNGSVPPVSSDELLASETLMLMTSVEGLGELDIGPPKETIGVNSFVPTVTGPEQTFPPFLTVGVDAFAPSFAGEISPPFLTVGVDPKSVFLLEGGLPPFVPPSLPPTLGGGASGGTPSVGPGVPLPPLSSGGLAGIRFYQGPPWRWVITDLDSSTITFLDRLTYEATVTYGLNRGSTAKLSMPSDNPEVNILHTDGEPFVSEGNRLLYGFRREGDPDQPWKIRFAGKILQVEDHGELENARTIVTAFDPWQLLYQRPMVNIDDEFPDKAGFFSFDDTQLGVIALTFLRNTILNQGELGIDIGFQVVGNMEEPMTGTEYWAGEFEDTTAIDTKFEQGMMVGEIWDQVLGTGALDIVLTPVYDPFRRPGIMADMSIFEEAGEQKDDAIFAWDKPSRNLQGIDSLKDGTKRANTIRYHWEQGGAAVNPGGIPISYGPSILKYGETWHTQFFPFRIEEAVAALAQLQLALMQDGIKTVQAVPAPERMPFLFTEFWLGDRVPVYASNRLRQAIAGYQRVYGVVLQIDENSYEQVPQLLVSPEEA